MCRGHTFHAKIFNVSRHAFTRYNFDVCKASFTCLQITSTASMNLPWTFFYFAPIIDLDDHRNLAWWANVNKGKSGLTAEPKQNFLQNTFRKCLDICNYKLIYYIQSSERRTNNEKK